MSKGSVALAQISRGPIHPKTRGDSLTPTAKITPIPRNKRRFANGPNQRKCRLTM